MNKRLSKQEIQSGMTFAQLSREEKNKISHRFLAFWAARKYLEATFGN